jgi:phospholipid transport system substrate-binding protein
MKTFRLGVATWIFALLILVPSLVIGGEATNQLSATIDGFVPIITNTPSTELRANGLPESARKLVLARFDFSEMTKRSLGRHWNSLDQGEQKQFVEAFTHRQLTYYGKTVHASAREKVQFGREVEDGKDVYVETRIVTRYGEALPINYWLHNVNGQWKVYDMVIDHVDLAKNFRAQFERVIAKSSLKELLERVKNQNPGS